MSLQRSYTASACSGFVSGRDLSKGKTMVIGYARFPPQESSKHFFCHLIQHSHQRTQQSNAWINSDQKGFACIEMYCSFFDLLIYLPIIWSGPRIGDFHLLQKNEVSKYIWASCTPSFPLLTIVISIYSSLHLVLLQLVFFSDFCSFWFLLSGLQQLLNIIYLKSETKTFGILIFFNCTLKHLSVIIS